MGEEQKAQDVPLLQRPCPPKDWPIVALRLPNVLSAEMRAFKPETAQQLLIEGYKESIDTMGHQVISLLTPENCIRWRFRKSDNGQIMTDDEGRPLYESNTRFVEWENGTTTLHVGSESFPMRKIPQKVV